MATRLVGIDIGSSAVKAAVFDAHGEQLAVSRVPCESTGDFDPERWWSATREALRRLDLNGVAAAGVCGRGATCVLLDAHGGVLAPSWNDGRASGLAAQLREAMPALSSQSLAMLAKATWFAGETGIRAAAAVSAKDFVTWRLTGVMTSDPASGGGPVPPLLPACDAWQLNGTATDSPLPSGTPVAVGWHDGAAAAFGAGASVEGAGPVTLGTNAVYRVVATTLPAGVRKYWDLTPNLTVTGGDIVAAGRAFAWAKSILQGADAARSSPGARGATFLPQFSGRIAPSRNPAATGTFAGLTGEQTADDLLRAVLEGTAFSLRQVRDWLAGQGLAATHVIATGGGSRNPAQIQALADALEAPVATASIEEGCRGAALLGAVAAGIIDLEEARTLKPRYTAVEPDPANAAAMEEAYQRFIALQAATDTFDPGART